jgi:peptidoglycan/LPS O-acetylase OafA/YrhL
MTAALAVREGWRPRWTILQAAVVSLAAWELMSALHAYKPLPNAIVTLPFLGVIAAAATSDIAGRSSWLTNRWAIYAGEVSFAFYLVHLLVIGLLQTQLSASGFFGSVLCLIVSIIAAVALHHGVERPAERRLRGARPMPPVVVAS